MADQYSGAMRADVLLADGSNTGIIVGGVILVVVLGVVFFLVMRSERNARKRPEEEQEAALTRIFQDRTTSGARPDDVEVYLKRFGIPVIRIKEIATANGYAYTGVRHPREGEYLQFSLKGLPQEEN